MNIPPPLNYNSAISRHPGSSIACVVKFPDLFPDPQYIYSQSQILSPSPRYINLFSSLRNNCHLAVHVYLTNIGAVVESSKCSELLQGLADALSLDLLVVSIRLGSTSTSPAAGVGRKNWVCPFWRMSDFVYRSHMAAMSLRPV